MSKRKPRGYWTLERCMEDAIRFNRPADWKKGSPSGYAMAQRKGWLAQCKAHMTDGRKPNGYWSLSKCKEEALKYESRSDWQRESVRSYATAQYYGYLPECTAHMELKIDHGKWDEDSVLKSASSFKTKTEWRRSEGGAYNAAKVLGIYEQATAHMARGYGATDNDDVYLWRDGSTEIHKVGVTSSRVGESRIAICRRHNDMDPRIVFMLKVADARAVESQLLELGTDPQLDSSIDGYTEFRELTNDDLREAVSIAYSAALAA